jgi:hypothetical protein
MVAAALIMLHLRCTVVDIAGKLRLPKRSSGSSCTINAGHLSARKFETAAMVPLQQTATTNT